MQEAPCLGHPYLITPHKWQPEALIPWQGKLQDNLLKRRKVTTADQGRPFMRRDKIPLSRFNQAALNLHPLSIFTVSFPVKLGCCLCNLEMSNNTCFRSKQGVSQPEIQVIISEDTEQSLT